MGFLYSDPVFGPWSWGFEFDGDTYEDSGDGYPIITIDDGSSSGNFTVTGFQMRIHGVALTEYHGDQTEYFDFTPGLLFQELTFQIIDGVWDPWVPDDPVPFNVQYLTRLPAPEAVSFEIELDNICTTEDFGLITNYSHALEPGQQYIWEVATTVTGPWEELVRSNNNNIVINSADVADALGESSVLGETLQLRVRPSSFGADSNHDDLHTSIPVQLHFLKGAPLPEVSSSSESCEGASDGSLTLQNMTYADGSNYVGDQTLIYTFYDPLGIPHQYESSNTTVTVDDSTIDMEGYAFEIYPGEWSVTIESAGRCISESISIVVPEASPVSITNVNSENITCENGDDGEVEVNVNDGQPPYTYEIYDNSTFTPPAIVSQGGVSSTSYTFSGLSAGTYYARVSDNCSATFLEYNSGIQLDDPSNPVTIQEVLTTDVICPDNPATGTLSTEITQGTSDFAYRLFTATNTLVGSSSSSLRSHTFNNLVAGTYFVEVEDGSGCTIVSNQVIINTGGNLTASANSNDITCFGEANGAILISATGASGAYEYSIDGGSTFGNDPSFTGLAVGDYYPVVRDLNDNVCQWNGALITITEPAAPLTISGLTESLPVKCFGDTNGQVTVSATGGTTEADGYMFTLSRSGTEVESLEGLQVDFSGLPSGSYDVNVTDNNGCTTSGSITLLQPTPVSFESIIPSVFTGGNNISCAGASDGQLTVSTSGGVYPHSITVGSTTLQQNGLTESVVFNGLTAGIHNLLIEDANNCTETATVTLTEPIEIEVTDIVTTDVVCSDSPGTGTASISVTNGLLPITFTLFRSDDTELSSATVNEHSYNFEGLNASAYYIRVMDVNGCEVVSPEVTVGTLEDITASISPTRVDCKGNSNGTITINASGSTGSFEYSIDGGVSYQTSYVFTGLAANTYDCVIRDVNDLSCLYTNSVEISEPAQSLSVSSLTEVGSIECNGDVTGAINVTAAGGTTSGDYEYRLTHEGAVIETQLGATANFTDLAAGFYDVEVLDENGCSTFDNIELTEPDGLGFNEVIRKTYGSDLHVSCNGAVDGEVAIRTVGGTFPHEVTLNGVTNIVGNASEQIVFSNLSAGIYDVTVQDANNCTSIISTTLEEPEVLSIQDLSKSVFAGGFNISCNGGADGTISIRTSGGRYPHTVIIEGQEFTLSNDTETAIALDLTAKTYQVDVVDANGCNYYEDVMLTEPDVVSFTDIQTDQLACNGDADAQVRVFTSGGVFPHDIEVAGVTNANLTASDVAVFSSLPSGTYLARITDANRCVRETSFEITEPNAISIEEEITSSPPCYNDNTGSVFLRAEGGVPINGTDYRYVLEHLNVPEGLPFYFPEVQEKESAEVTFEELIAGDYSLNIYDENGCVYNEIVSLYTSSQLDLDVTTTPVTCKADLDGTASFQISGGAGPYNVEYQNNFRENIGSFDLTEGELVTLSNFAEGVYYLRITDSNGCGFYNPNYTFHVNGPAEALQLNAIVSNVICEGEGNGSVLLEASGGWQSSSYLYGERLSDLGINNYYFDNLPPGRYTYYVEDNNGCSASVEVTISEPEALNVSIASILDVSCNGLADGSFHLDADGGTSPYEVSVDGGVSFAETTAVENLKAGLYDVIIKDANSCEVLITVEITEPDVLELSLASVQNSLCGQSNGSVSVDVSGGSLPFTYSWFDSDGNNLSSDPILSGVPDGRYHLTLSDANGCGNSISATVNNLNTLSTSLVDIKGESCAGSGDGQARVLINEAANPYEIIWSTGAEGEKVSDLSEGNHSVTIKDANGCEETHQFEITSPEKMVASISKFEPICNGECTGEIRVDITGGTAPYAYSWAESDHDENALNNLCAGNYTVKIIDANGCELIEQISLAEPQELSIPIQSQYDICTGQIMSINGGDFAAYNWTSSGEFISSEKVLQLNESGSYNLQVTNEEGCVVNKAFEVSVSSDALEANFLIPDEAYVGDTVVCIDISLPEPESIAWIYDKTVAVDVGAYDEYQELVFVKPGDYTIGMEVTLAECQTSQTKSIKIIGGQNEGRKDHFGSLIKSFKVYPNPSDGEFEVKVELSKSSTIALLVTNNSGVLINKNVKKGSDEYLMKYDLSGFRSGVYNLLLAVGGQKKTLRILIH